MIPKIIWQTYELDFDELPDGAKIFAKSWIDANPNWEYRYMSGEERKYFILEHYGKKWLDIYNSYKYNVTRADLWRYLVLNKYGGLYLDLDISCNSSIDDWIKDEHSFVVSAEPGMSDLTQMIFASEPNHPILNILLEMVKNNTTTKYTNLLDYIRLTCGFTVFTNSIIKFLKLEDGFNFAKNSPEVYNKNGIRIYSGEESLVIHGRAMTHHHAGHGNLWKNYEGWLTLDWKEND